MARKFSAFSIATVAMAMLVLSALTVPSIAQAQQSLGLKRVASQFTAFDGTFIDVDDAFTDTGVPIFNNPAIKVPGGSNFAYITVNASASGQCNGIAFNCKLDGASCNGGFNPNTQGFENPVGWITLAGNSDSVLTNHGTSSFGPTNISYTWCTPLIKTKKNLHEVIINAAQDTVSVGQPVFCTEILSAVSVFIDVNNVRNKNFIDNTCTSYVNPNEF